MNSIYDNLSIDEYRVIRLLEGLDENERVTASQIMDRLMIKDIRHLHQIIFDLRMKGFPIVSSKSGHSGYWIARSRAELKTYLRKKQLYIATHQKVIQAMENAAESYF